MENKINVAELVKELKESDFFMHAGIPLGYTAGLPILTIRNENLCLRIPYLRYKITGQEDKTLVYPVRYIIDVVLPEKQVVHFEDLAYHPSFRKVNFGKAVGLFRHDAIKHLNKEAYKQERLALMAEYDKVIDMLLNGAAYSVADEQRMCKLLRMLIEPSLLPIYHALDKDFYNKYIIGEDGKNQ